MKPDLLISFFLRNRRRRGALLEKEPSLGHPKCRVPWPRSAAQPGKRKHHLPHFSAGKAAGAALQGTAPGAPGSVWGTALCPAPRHPQPRSQPCASPSPWHTAPAPALLLQGTSSTLPGISIKLSFSPINDLQEQYLSPATQTQLQQGCAALRAGCAVSSVALALW